MLRISATSASCRNRAPLGVATIVLIVLRPVSDPALTAQDPHRCSSLPSIQDISPRLSTAALRRSGDLWIQIWPLTRFCVTMAPPEERGNGVRHGFGALA